MRNRLLALLVLTSLASANTVETSKLSDSVDLSNYKEIQKKDTKIVFDANASEFDGIYNYSYNESTDSAFNKTNIFLDGNFEKIHRYESLYFKDNMLTRDSNETLQRIMKKIHSYRDDKSREIVVSVLGFTQKTQNDSKDLDLDSAYTNFFQSIGQRDNLKPSSASDESLNFIEVVYKKMLEDNISKEIIYKENRIGNDNLFTEEFSDGRSLNNRVDIAIYVKEVLDPDTDRDGVRDSKDFCPQTPVGSNVDTNGCPLIMSLDLKFDFDKATISEEKSLNNVQKLSDFMKKYPAYHANIVGHTDSDGSDEYNQILSLKRAEAVKNLIVNDGVKASRLSYEGRGESEPLFQNSSEVNRHKNRRTEVELTLDVPESKRSRIKPRSRGVEE